MSKDVELVAIFSQQSSDSEEELKLIQSVSIREIYLEKLIKIIESVRDRRRICDLDCMYETVVLMNQVRSSTVIAINNIGIWQRKYTNIIRPIILNCDYIKKRIIEIMRFMNNTTISNILNFNLGQYNFLLLPMVNNKQKNFNVFEVSTKLYNEIMLFSNPNRDDVIQCYQILLNCLNNKYYDQIFQINLYFQNVWKPSITINKLLDIENKSNLPIIQANRLHKRRAFIKFTNNEDKLQHIGTIHRQTALTNHKNTIINTNDSKKLVPKTNQLLIERNKHKEVNGNSNNNILSTHQLRDWYIENGTHFTES